MILITAGINLNYLFLLFILKYFDLIESIYILAINYSFVTFYHKLLITSLIYLQFFITFLKHFNSQAYLLFLAIFSFFINHSNCFRYLIARFKVSFLLKKIFYFAMSLQIGFRFVKSLFSKSLYLWLCFLKMICLCLIYLYKLKKKDLFLFMIQ